TTRLLVRDYEDGDDRVIDPAQWRFAREMDDGTVVEDSEHVYLSSGFEVGKLYQLVYTTDRAPIAALGLLALRDVAPFLRNGSTTSPATGQCRSMIAWGVSQTGRMLRHFMSLGLNATEDGELAYEGIAPHIAGARRGAFNHRFAQPSNQTTPLWGHVFPFADDVTQDPFSDRSGGLLDALKATGNVPKVVSTDSAAEYWRGDAALSHIDPAGTHDLKENPNTRRYLFASNQHVAGYLGQPRFSAGINTMAREPMNIVDYRPLLRAALVNLDRWIRDGTEPPASLHPRLSDGTAVTRDIVTNQFATLPGFKSPNPKHLPFLRTVDLGAEESVGVGVYPAKEGGFYPALVSSVDQDGNELAGIRLPDVSVPVATHAGWNPRDPQTGAPEQIVPMSGLSLYFAATVQSRNSGDPRRALNERYESRDDYQRQVESCTQRLVDSAYVLPEDAAVVVEAALTRYDAAASASIEQAAAQ
ncbi:MAG: hypothetical protein HOI95_18810, partial [Chromatiales bacterium]|nr:hypothetical protein [Chromatiales bacterium]